MPFIKHIPPEDIEACKHPEHAPPTGIYLQPGLHIYECPSCKKTYPIRVTDIHL